MTRRKMPKNGTRFSIPAGVKARQTLSLSIEVAKATGKQCTDDPELFFPVGVTAEAKKQAKDAKALCRQCPVQAECLEMTLRGEAENPAAADGVFGGFTQAERVFEVQARRREAAKAAAKEAVADADQDVDMSVLQPAAAEEVAA